MKKIIIIAITSLTMAQVFAADSYIYKFNDKNGSKIYTDRLPANEKGEFSVMTRKSGMIKKVVEREMTDEEIIQRDINVASKQDALMESELQKRKDVSLIGTYANAEEIDRLKKYELDQIDQVIKSYNEKMENINSNLKILEANKNLATNESLSKQHEKQLNEKTVLEKNLSDSKEMRIEREKKYNDDKERYLQIIKSMASGN